VGAAHLERGRAVAVIVGFGVGRVVGGVIVVVVVVVIDRGEVLLGGETALWVGGAALGSLRETRGMV
jgi:hypothetical protein